MSVSALLADGEASAPHIEASWRTITTVSPWLSRNSASRSMIRTRVDACTVTSRAVVGSCQPSLERLGNRGDERPHLGGCPPPAPTSSLE
jgi:hypothetical protein